MNIYRDPVAVSSPGGGVARQFRVQFHVETEDKWRMYGSFRTLEQAENCLTQLHQRGFQARLVKYNICPVGG